MNQQDICQRFLFEHTAVRGEIVHLNDSFKQIMEQHRYPSTIRALLGEALVAAALLAETIKFDGELTLQLQNDGPVTLLVAKCDSKGHIRGLAQWQEDVVPLNAPAALGDGRLVVTIQYAKKVQPYQSIIPIQGRGIAEAIVSYFQQSEQLPTRIFTAVSERGVSGLLLQMLPAAGDVDASHALWQTVELLAETIQSDELLQLGNQEILYRLFHEYDLRLFDPKPIKFQCNCTVERMERAVITLGEAEAKAILRDKAELEVTCEYCNNVYGFTKAEVEQLFSRH